MELTFRKADMEDLDGICAMVKASVARMHEEGIFQWDDEYPSREVFAEDIEKGELFIGSLEGRMAVIYVLNQEPHEDYAKGNWQYDEPYFVVHRLCVSVDFQHQGIARRALLYIEDELRKNGIYAIRLDTFTKNPFAMRLYESLDYDKVGKVEWLPRGMFQLFEKHL